MFWALKIHKTMVMFVEGFVVCKDLLYFLCHLVQQTSLCDQWGKYNCSFYVRDEETDTQR